MAWLWFALISSFSTSIVSPLRKKIVANFSPITVLWTPGFLAIPFYIYLIAVNGLPSLNGIFGVYLLATVILEIACNLVVIYALKIEDISVIAPLFALGPVFSYFVNIIFLNIPFHWVGLIGVAMVVLGSILVHLNVKKKSWGLKFSLGSTLAVLVALIWGFGSLFFVIGIRSSNLLGFVSAINLIITIVLLILDVFVLNKPFPKKYIFTWPNLAITFFSFVSWIGEFNAVVLVTQPAYVGAVRRLDILLNILYGKIFWNEKGFAQKFLAGIVILIGVLIIILKG